MNGPTEPLARALLGRYELERELGTGGMATVFLARDMKHHRSVAVKVLSEDATEHVSSDRFLREIEIVAGLTHPNILPLHDSGTAAGRRFLVMPYIDGGTLRVVRGGSFGRYAATGHILYADPRGTVLGLPYDLDRMAATGAAAPILEGVRVATFGGAASFVLSRAGTIAYVLGSTYDMNQLEWVGRDGRRQGQL